MNIENINDGKIFNINLKNQRRKIYNSVSNKINILTRRPKFHHNIQKNFILKLLNINSNDKKQNQISKINNNLSRLNIKKNLNLNDNFHSNDNEEFLSDKEIKYKIKVQEKNKIIHNLMNEIDYYKDIINNKNNNINNNINNNLNIHKFFNYSPKRKLELNDIDLSLGKNKQYITIDNELMNNFKIKSSSPNNIINNNINILINDNNSVKNIFKKHKYKFPELKKNKLIQKRNNNLTQVNHIIEKINISKINHMKSGKRNDTFNTIDYYNSKKKLDKTKLLSINLTNSNNIGNNDDCDFQKTKMEDLSKRMNNLIENLFSIIENKKKK